MPATSASSGGDERSRPTAGTDTTDRAVSERTDDGTRSAPGDPDIAVLVVGTFGGGGVNQYVDEQVARLEGRVSVATHAMGMPPAGSGATWFVRGVVLALVAMARFPLQSRPDVVHVHTSHRFSFYRSSIYVLYSRYVWRVPVVLHVHGSSFDEFVGSASPPVAAVQSFVFDACDDVIVLSAYWRDVLAERVDPATLRVLPNAVDPDRYEAEIDAEPPRIVFVSNLIERKGVRELVDALDDVLDRTERPVAVDIAGDGPLSEQVERLAATHDAVTYHGYVSEPRKRALLRDGSTFVLPTYAEGLPIALLEGMAAGNAIVSTPVGAIPEVVDDGGGVLVTPGDRDELADALAELLADSDRRTAMARRNRRLVEERYTWEQVVDELLTLYERRANESRRSSQRADGQ